jgi:CheY-like chemotaxis protein
MPNSEPILLVEDHADTAAALFQILTARGYSVSIAENGQQALDILDRGVRPRLILVDLMLPRVSGWELLSYLQSDPELRHTPTVVITGVPKHQVRVIADAVFSKPLDFYTLASTIDQLVVRQP